MEIKNIKINNYGTLKQKEINLENNINIIYGKNESGKSTLLNYLKNIFYGISKNKNGKEISDYEKYLPWDGEDFSGKIKYQLNNGNTFEIFRDFNKKNPIIFNQDLRDVSSDFKIDKKDGNQYFYEQTGIDEKTYISTIMSLQQEVVLNNQNQNILIQKLSNIMGTGEDKVSFQKAMERLNKKLVEEVGTSRTQDRPINIIQNRMEKVSSDLKTKKEVQKNKEMLQEKKDNLMEKLKCEEEKNNNLNKLNLLFNKFSIELEKNNLKNKMRLKYDKVENVTYIQDKTSSPYINSNSFNLFIAKTNTNADLWIRISYTGDNWIFFNKIILNIDGQKNVIPLDYYEVNRDNAYGEVWEFVNLDYNRYENLINKIINSKTTLIRLTGERYYDKTITNVEKQAMKRVIEYYNLIK